MVKISSIRNSIIYIYLFIALSLLKPFVGSHTYFWTVTILVILTFTLFFFEVLRYKSFKNIALRNMLIIWSFFLFIAVGKEIVAGTSVNDIYRATERLLYVYLAIPVFYSLYNGSLSLDVLIRRIMQLTFVSYLLRFAISMIEHFTGRIILEEVAFESMAKTAVYRNGWMRINPPCFSNVIITLSFYVFLTTKKKKERIFSSLLIVMALVYSFYIHAARSMSIYMVLELCLLILIKNRSGRKQFIVFNILTLCACLLLGSGVLDTLIMSFSKSGGSLGGAYGGSTTSRLLSLEYFGSMYLRHPITGVGLLTNSKGTLYDSLGYVMGDVADIGFMHIVFQLGIGAIIFLLSFFIRSYKAGKISKSYDNHEYRVLVWGIGFSVLITGINIDWFYSIFAPTVPILLAIVEYIYCNQYYEVCQEGYTDQ